LSEALEFGQRNILAARKEILQGIDDLNIILNVQGYVLSNVIGAQFKIRAQAISLPSDCVNENLHD
jgi:hypothetical protein